MEVTNRSSSTFNRRHQAKIKWDQSDTAKASSVRDISVVKIKFDHGAMLLAAVLVGDTEETIRLLREGADVNYANIDGLTSLHQACIDENLPMVKLLIDNGALIDACDNEGWTPLHASATTASLEIIKYLVGRGADITAVNTDGELPADLAEESRIQEYLNEEMSRRGVDPTAARNREFDLMMKDVNRWVRNGRIEAVKSPNDVTPLHVGASKGYLAIVQSLLSLGADPNSKDSDGWTPLHAALYWKKGDVAEELIKSGGDINIKNNEGHTPVKLAENEMKLVVRKLMAKYKLTEKDDTPTVSSSRQAPDPTRKVNGILKVKKPQTDSRDMKSPHEETTSGTVTELAHPPQAATREKEITVVMPSRPILPPNTLPSIRTLIQNNPPKPKVPGIGKEGNGTSGKAISTIPSGRPIISKPPMAAISRPPTSPTLIDKPRAAPNEPPSEVNLTKKTMGASNFSKPSLPPVSLAPNLPGLQRTTVVHGDSDESDLSENKSKFEHNQDKLKIEKLEKELEQLRKEKRELLATIEGLRRVIKDNTEGQIKSTGADQRVPRKPPSAISRPPQINKPSY